MDARFSRRILLRGLGGAAVAAPFLGSLAERAAKGSGVAAPAAPRRLIVFFTHYGCLTNRWFPARSHGPLGKSDYLAMRTLAPLSPYADKLLMVRGIRAMNEWSFEGTLGQRNDPHTQVCGSYFTCHPVTPNSPDGGVSSVGKYDAKPTGRSLDHVAAEQINAGGAPPLFIQIGGRVGVEANTSAVISYRQPGQLFPGTDSPLEIYSGLTNLFGAGPVSPDTYLAARRKSVIDIVRDDLDSLVRVDMSLSDRKKLSAWAELLHQTGATVATQCGTATAAKLGLTADTVAAAQAVSKSSFSDLPVVSRTLMDLATLTALCDANRVIFMKMPPNFVAKFLGLTTETNSLSHRTGSAMMGGACIPSAIDQIQMIDSWYAQQFAYLVGRLDSFAEGERTLLDSTATVWFQEMSDGDAHNLNNLPILQAGSCADYFKVGQAINVEGGKPDMTAGHSDEDCQNGQTPKDLDLVGTPPDVATQPINKYFCTLLNAVGVKAGADGFPAPGGTQPVTRYGKYDDTRLFKTEEPPTIKDPGEYAALRAG